MPIEIRELVIKTTIVDNEVAGLRNKSHSVSKKDLEKLKKEIIELCIEKIEDKINKHKER
ncbi:MAG: DUF5908 family protein [Bacteroidota bacterium]|jgi:hypothetical protein|nr:hypothetical protein [Bacteroidota bacterium]MCA6442121.1 hypothetical protein [Bacteroidota bacterium]